MLIYRTKGTTETGAVIFFETDNLSEPALTNERNYIKSIHEMKHGKINWEEPEKVDLKP